MLLMLLNSSSIIQVGSLSNDNSNAKLIFNVCIKSFRVLNKKFAKNTAEAKLAERMDLELFSIVICM